MKILFTLSFVLLISFSCSNGQIESHKIIGEWVWVNSLSDKGIPLQAAVDDFSLRLIFSLDNTVTYNKRNQYAGHKSYSIDGSYVLIDSTAYRMSFKGDSLFLNEECETCLKEVYIKAGAGEAIYMVANLDTISAAHWPADISNIEIEEGTLFIYSTLPGNCGIHPFKLYSSTNFVGDKDSSTVELHLYHLSDNSGCSAIQSRINAFDLNNLKTAFKDSLGKKKGTVYLNISLKNGAPYPETPRYKF